MQFEKADEKEQNGNASKTTHDEEKFAISKEAWLSPCCLAGGEPTTNDESYELRK